MTCDVPVRRFIDQAEYQRVDVHEGLDSTITLLEHRLADRIEVVRDFGDLPPVDCYPQEINQVYMNLLSNALEASDGKGTIHVRTRAESGLVRIEIQDTGRGIEAGRLEHILEPGFTSKGTRVGMGLGLSQSNDIVRKHGGQLRLESEPGAGTTTTITLPARL